MSAGRYAPSPSGDLHIGNLRTALLAWLFARSSGRDFYLRIEDLDDRTSTDIAQRQLADLAAIGIDWDGDVTYQSHQPDLYLSVIAELTERGLTYECYCARREIHAAPRAPHVPVGTYPGTCRDLSDAQRSRRRVERPAAVRLRADLAEYSISDELHGMFTRPVDDFVLLRGDGTPAYNLAVVVDDAKQGIDQVVRGDDLLDSTPRQAYLATLLGYEVPNYAHVPLVLNGEGKRLAKRDGAVTLTDLAKVGVGPELAVRRLLDSLGIASESAKDAVAAFDAAALPRDPWIYGGWGSDSDSVEPSRIR